MEQENFNQLIVKQLSDKLGADEAARLHEALQSDAAAQIAAAQFARTWQATGQLPEPNFGLNLDIEFARLRDRIGADGEQETGRTVQLSPRRNWFRYAAAAAVIGLAAIGAWQFLGEKNAPLLAGNDAAKSELRLEDGSHVFINKASKLTYPSHFSAKDRLVSLEGEAFFEIAKDAEKPFIIETEVAKIRVVGTKFNVRSAADRCEVFVEEGHVIVENNGQTGHLTSGQGVIVFRDGAKFQPSNPPNAAAWAHGELRFDNEVLVDVLADLSHFYGAKITTDDGELQNRRFSWSKPVSGKLENVLETIAETFGARVVRVSEKEFKLIKK